jgi:hypothetical protein
VLLVFSAPAAGCSASARPLGPRCIASDSTAQITVTNRDLVDVLFVISDSPSMAEQQAALQHELPEIVRALVTGEVGGMKQFEPIQDLQVGVVSASLADGTALHRVPVAGVDGCSAEYPGFLHYHGSYYGPARDDVPAYLQSVECMAQVGSAASAPSQPLEAALRVLSDPNATAGFLRNDPIKGLSLIVIIVVADTDDCSLTGDAGTRQVASSPRAQLLAPSTAIPCKRSTTTSPDSARCVAATRISWSSPWSRVCRLRWRRGRGPHRTWTSRPNATPITNASSTILRCKPSRSRTRQNACNPLAAAATPAQNPRAG